MLRVISPINNIRAVAVSGGIDSMVLLHFLRRSNRDILAVNFHHGTQFGEMSQRWLINYCRENNINLTCGRMSAPIPRGESAEHWWREERYKFLSTIDGPIAIAHNLNDQIETYIMNMVRGNPRFMPYKRDNIVRPIILSTRESIVAYSTKNGVPYLDDPSNNDVTHPRNRIRHRIIPDLQLVNPGLLKTFYKMAVRDILKTNPNVTISTSIEGMEPVMAPRYERWLEL